MCSQRKLCTRAIGRSVSAIAPMIAYHVAKCFAPLIFSSSSCISFNFLLRIYYTTHIWNKYNFFHIYVYRRMTLSYVYFLLYVYYTFLIILFILLFFLSYFLFNFFIISLIIFLLFMRLLNTCDKHAKRNKHI